MTIKDTAGESLDDLLDFRGDDIAGDKVGIVKDGAEKALRFLSNLFVKIALWSFCLPEAPFQIKAIAQHPIRTDTALDGLLWYQHPFHLVSSFSQKVEKRRSDG